MIQTRRSPQPPPEARKNSHLWSCQLQTACSEWAPKISLQLQSSTWRVLFQQYLDLFSFTQVSSITENGRALSPEMDYVLGSSRTMVPGCQKGVFSFPITSVVMGKSLHP